MAKRARHLTSVPTASPNATPRTRWKDTANGTGRYVPSDGRGQAALAPGSHGAIPATERVLIRARAMLREEGYPCTFVPAWRDTTALDAAANVAAAAVWPARTPNGAFPGRADLAAWDSIAATDALAALVTALRPYAGDPVGMVGAIGAAAEACPQPNKSTGAMAKAAAAEVKRSARTERARAKRSATRPVAVSPSPSPAAPVRVEPAPAQPAIPTPEEIPAMATRAPRARTTPLTATQDHYDDTMAAARARRDEVHAPAPADAPVIPEVMAQYLARLVYVPKAVYARAVIAHLYCGAPEPEAPDAEWAAKVRAKIERLSARKVAA
jgi:hypothetical protein